MSYAESSSLNLPWNILTYCYSMSLPIIWIWDLLMPWRSKLTQLQEVSGADLVPSLYRAIKEFSGGCVIVSHDFRLISQVAEQLWGT